MGGYLYEISEPLAEPVTLDEVINHLKVLPSLASEESLLIKSLISSARMEAEALTGGRVFVEREFEYVIPGNLPAPVRIILPLAPVTAIVGLYDVLGEEVADLDYNFVKSSLLPSGRPLYGEIIFPEGVGATHSVRFKAGWPNKEEVSRIKLLDHPVFLPGSSVLNEGGKSLTLSFDRPVHGEVSTVLLYVDDNFVPAEGRTTDDGRLHVSMSLDEPLTGSENIIFSYTAGFLSDMDDNFVLPILNSPLLINNDGVPPEFPAYETETRVLSQVPSAVKAWVLTRVATLYQQRSSIAIQAGKTSNALFPRDFINSLLDPYRLEKV